jgi:hypothetical protein
MELAVDPIGVEVRGASGGFVVGFVVAGVADLAVLLSAGCDLSGVEVGIGARGRVSAG